MKQYDKADLLEAKLRALMIAGLSGHSGAYRTLLSLSAERLRSYFGRRLAGREYDVEDLVQETLIAVHRKRATYDQSLPFTAWLHGIARYRLIDFLRRDKRSRGSAGRGRLRRRGDRRVRSDTCGNRPRHVCLPG